MQHRFEFGGEKGTRLDRFLAERFAADKRYDYLSRSQIAALIQRGQVLVDGKIEKKSGFALKPGATIEVADLSPPSKKLEPYDFNIPILFEDRDIIVIDKPPGISMHPGAGRKRGGTVINALADKLKGFTLKSLPGEQLRPGVVHRLDKDTSGVVVLARNLRAHQKLSRQFADRAVMRRYLALVLLSPRAGRAPRLLDSGRIEGAIGRHVRQPTKMAIREEGGRAAATNWTVRERMKYGALLELKLETGRTHQIRVHLESIGCPVIGDKTYGDFSLLPGALRRAADIFGRQALHAATLGFLHPADRRELSFSSDLPEDFMRLLNEFRNYK